MATTTTKEQECEFIGEVVPATLLADAIYFIERNFLPDEVLDDEVLSDWALIKQRLCKRIKIKKHMTYEEIKELIHRAKDGEDLFNARVELAKYKALAEDELAYKILWGAWQRKSMNLVNKKAH